MAREPLGFVPAIVDDLEAAPPVKGGSHEIVIRTGALPIRVSPGVSADHIARVLAGVRRAG